MRINYFGYYIPYDGYGRWNLRLSEALRKIGIKTIGCTLEDREAPLWIQEEKGIDWSSLSITCTPPYALKRLPGRHWFISMTEGSRIPDDWVESINNSGVERVFVPCKHNVKAFIDSGVKAPVHVLHGGTDPDEFPIIRERPERPYTFLTFCDRGERKGWVEVWDSFYSAFGGKTTGEMNVRLIIKGLKQDGTTSFMAAAEGADKRIVYDTNHYADMKTLYSQADCLVLPSRSEGWGMPHREAACMGLPVILQKHSAFDDGDAGQWAIPLVMGKIKPIPDLTAFQIGEWMIADRDELAANMRAVFKFPEGFRDSGLLAATWIRENQTWIHSAKKILKYIEEFEDAPSLGRSTL